jgi:hypothetical protein
MTVQPLQTASFRQKYQLSLKKDLKILICESDNAEGKHKSQFQHSLFGQCTHKVFSGQCAENASFKSTVTNLTQDKHPLIFLGILARNILIAHKVHSISE